MAQTNHARAYARLIVATILMIVMIVSTRGVVDAQAGSPARVGVGPTEGTRPRDSLRTLRVARLALLHYWRAPLPRDTVRCMTQAANRGDGEVTRLLHRLQTGDQEALDRLYPLVYDELRRVARQALVRERDAHTLQATELVHEAYFKLVGATSIAWQDRSHFLAVAARAVRQLLVDHARRRQAEKRGGGAEHVTLGDADSPLSLPDEELLALDEALARLEAVEPRLRAVVEYRFFAGLTEREIAEVLGVTERTIQRDWVKARAWLYKEIYPAGSA